MSTDNTPTLLCLGNDPDLILAMKIISGECQDKQNKSRTHYESILTSALRRALSEAQRADESAECPALVESSKAPHS